MCTVRGAIHGPYVSTYTVSERGVIYLSHSFYLGLSTDFGQLW